MPKTPKKSSGRGIVRAPVGVPAPPTAATRPSARVVYVSAPSINEKVQFRYGSLLTPQAVTAVFRRADMGHMDSIADMFDEVRETDPHLHAVLFKREAAVAGAPWRINPNPRTKAKKRAQLLADMCTEQLESIRNLTSVFAHLQSAVYHGRSAVENVWGISGRRYPFFIDRMEPVHQRRVHFTSDWRPHLWDVSGGLQTDFGRWPGVPFEDFPRGKFTLHMPRIRGGYPTREGLGRVLVWYSVFKRWTMRDWMALAEMAGRPARVGYFNTGADGKPEASEQDIALLENALKDWASAMNVSLPDTVRIEFEGAATGHNDTHSILSEHCNAEMSKAVLMNTLTTEVGKTGGNRALGDTQQDGETMVTVWDAKALADTIRYDVLAPISYLNVPAAEATDIPLIEFQVEAEEDREKLARVYSTLALAGLDIDQNEVREEFNLSEPAEGAKLLIPRAPATVTSTGEDPPEPALPAGGDAPFGGGKGAAKTKPGAKKPPATKEAPP